MGSIISCTAYSLRQTHSKSATARILIKGQSDFTILDAIVRIIIFRGRDRRRHNFITVTSAVAGSEGSGVVLIDCEREGCENCKVTNVHLRIKFNQIAE
eukprot:g65908.t1